MCLDSVSLEFGTIYRNLVEECADFFLYSSFLKTLSRCNISTRNKRNESESWLLDRNFLVASYSGKLFTVLGLEIHPQYVVFSYGFLKW